MLRLGVMKFKTMYVYIFCFVAKIIYILVLQNFVIKLKWGVFLSFVIKYTRKHYNMTKNKVTSLSKPG